MSALTKGIGNTLHTVVKFAARDKASTAAALTTFGIFAAGIINSKTPPPSPIKSPQKR